MEHFLRLDVNFLKQDAVFFPGEKLNGVICIEIRQPLRVQELYVELCGQLNVRRSTLTNAVFSSVGRTTEDIVSMRQILVRTSELSDRHMDINFSFTLPRDSPQSLEAWPLAEMRYFIDVVAQFPSNKQTKTLSVRRLFTVLEERFPVEISSVSQSSRMTLMKPTYALFCYEEGLIEAQLNLKKIYFVPGEDVVASILVDNQSSKHLKKVTFSILQVVRKTLATHPNERLTRRTRVARAALKRTVCQKQCIGTTEIGPVAPSGLARHRRCKVHLPAVPCTASNIGQAGSRRHIDISYIVQLKIVLPCLERNIVLTSPFVVGTAPLPSTSPARMDTHRNGAARAITPRHPLKTYPSAFVESANGPVSYRGLTISHPSGTLTGRQLAVLCVYTPQYFYFPTISCTPKPGTPSTLRSILKPRSMCSSASGSTVATSSVFSDTASTVNSSYVSDSYLNIHFESPV